MHTVGLPRTCLGFTNILFFFFGFVGFVICIWCAINTEFFRDVNYTITKSSLVSAIANFVNLKLWFTPLTTVFLPVAVLAMMTSCCGLLGAGCKMKCAIKSYIFLVTILSTVAFWLFFISGIYNIYTRNERMRNYLQSTIRTQYGADNDLISRTWDFLMVNYECCGAVDYRDFLDSNWQKKHPDLMYPVQCCVFNKTSRAPISENCTKSVESDIKNYKDKGCMYALRKCIADNKGLIIFYIILSGMLYCVIILFAYCIIKGEPLISTVANGLGVRYTPPSERSQQVLTIPMSDPTVVQPRFTYVEEPPKKIVKVVSAVNPFQSYKLTNSYDHEMCAHNIRTPL